MNRVLTKDCGAAKVVKSAHGLGGDFAKSYATVAVNHAMAVELDLGKMDFRNRVLGIPLVGYGALWPARAGLVARHRYGGNQ